MTKTPGSKAILALPDICLTALQLRAERHAADRVRAGDIWHDTRLVFTTTLSTPYEPRNFARHFALRCSKAGVSHIRVHDTRRTCASLLVALNVHPRVAMQILRHSQIAITMQVSTAKCPPKPRKSRATPWAQPGRPGCYCCTYCCTKIKEGRSRVVNGL